MAVTHSQHSRITGLLATILVGCAAPRVAPSNVIRNSGVPVELERWLAPQVWERDTDEPVIRLGERGEFDETHVFAPCVIRRDGRYSLLYCGSRGAVADRVFAMGLATSGDGREFDKHKGNPVLAFEHSVLTPTVLRGTDGSAIVEGGRLRLWFASADLTKGGRHQLFEASSSDGVRWSKPSGPLLDDVYAPTILREGRHYRMWYTDVSGSAWVIRHALSLDGRKWLITREPVLHVDQEWEKSNLFYPTVVKTDGIYLMWYGSYWSAASAKTAIGFAASLDGIRWYKSPHNPVLRPDPKRAWESHYTTSQSVMPMADGSFRIWYASRKKPPFRNKYFAISTARWRGPRPAESESPALRLAREDRQAFTRWQVTTRRRLSTMLGIPKRRVPLDVERRGEIRSDGIDLEKLVFTSERGSKVPAILYRPRTPRGRMPAVVLTYGHGGSKSQPIYQYIAQLYARLGIACLAIDPIGEEERHAGGRMGTRAHDPEPVHRRAWEAGRPIMGKLVWDTMRGVDLLLSRSDIDPSRIGIAGNSLGGAIASWMAVLDVRLRFAIISGWAFDDLTLRSKFCTRVPNERMREMLAWDEYLALAAPHCAVLVVNGDADVIIDLDSTGAAWEGTRNAVAKAGEVFRLLANPERLACWFEAGGGHRPYPAHRRVLSWLVDHAQPPGLTREKIGALPILRFGSWTDANRIELEKLYGTELHLRGASVVDLDVPYLRRGDLTVLDAEERGQKVFTLDGWLTEIERQARRPHCARVGTNPQSSRWRSSTVRSTRDSAAASTPRVSPPLPSMYPPTSRSHRA